MPKEENIKALMVLPGQHPCITILKNDLDSLQKAVSIGSYYQGLIEVIDLGDNVCLICNEEAKLISLVGNRRIGNDIIAGVFYIVGTDDDGNFASLSQDEINKYGLHFWEPEAFTEKEVADSVWMEFHEILDAND